MADIGTGPGGGHDSDRGTRVEAERRFLSMAAHDLRAPLTRIVGVTGMLQEVWDSMDDDRRKYFLGRIAKQAERMRGLVDDFLVSVRLQAGAMTPQTRAVAPAPALHEIVSDLDPVAGDIGIDVDDGVPSMAADPGFFQQIVTNLLTNAMKYGEPPVAVRAHRDGHAVVVSVSDQGPGIPDQHLPALFDRFSPAAAAHNQQGTGLGLSIVRELATAMDGDVRYEPNEPRGARCVVRLPVASDS